MTDHRRAHVLTGGGTGAVDKIDGAGLAAGDTIQCINSDGIYNYVNIQDSAAENIPYVIRPDTNPGTNSWHLVTPQGPMSHSKANDTGGQSGIVSGVPTKVDYTTKVYDKLVEYNDTTSTFTATHAGLYLIKASAFFTPGAAWPDGTSLQLILYLNGASNENLDLWRAEDGVGFYSPFVGGSTTLELSATDYLNIYIQHASGANSSISSSAGWNNFVIDRMM